MLQPFIGIKKHNYSTERSSDNFGFANSHNILKAAYGTY